MRGIPEELLLILFFIAFVAFKYFVQRGAEKRKVEAEMPELDSEAIDEEAFAPLPASVPAQRARAAQAQATAPGRRRRFSKQSLLGNPRQVQDAFVVATILGRCRADEPHEVR